MISKKTADRAAEIDFKSIINSDEPGGVIRHLVTYATGLEESKRIKFQAAAVTYYGYLMELDFEDSKKQLNQDQYMLLWVETCLSKESLFVLLAGIYQLLKWEKSCIS